MFLLFGSQMPFRHLEQQIKNSKKHHLSGYESNNHLLEFGDRCNECIDVFDLVLEFDMLVSMSFE